VFIGIDHIMTDEKPRMVKCLKLERELPGLEKPPLPGALGQKIFENVSKEAWALWWDDMQIKVLNEYRLNLGSVRDYQVLMDQMAQFLNLPPDKAS
jgi:Fe-S cluster biosynthesis and repair protein YggX